MKCPACNTTVAEEELYCPKCGTQLKSDSNNSSFQDSQANAGVQLLQLNHLNMVHNKMARRINFTFEDSNGNVLGEALGEALGEGMVVLKYTIVDPSQQPLFILSTTGRFRITNYNIEDPNGKVLATLKMKSSFMGRKYALDIDDAESMLVTADVANSHFKIVGLNGNLISTGTRLMALMNSSTEIDIAEDAQVDHRIVLGAMVMINFFSYRGIP